MINKPLISVVIPLFNKEAVVKKTIDSVLSQTYNNFEIVVVDDGSSDHSVESIRQYKDDRVSLYLKNNGGPSSARNYGTEKSKGDWILFLDADDELLPNALEYLVEPINDKNTKIDVVCGNFNIIRDSNVKRHHLSKYRGFVPAKKKMYWLFIGNCFPRTGAAIINKKLLDKLPFPDNLRRFEDLCVIIKWMKSGHIYMIPDVVFNYCRDTEDASKPANEYNNDFIFHMEFENASFWEKCLLGNLYGTGLKLYPKQRNLLKSKYGKWNFFRYFGQVVSLAHILCRRYVERK